MKKAILGNTNIQVSKLCFGSLTMTPFQANLPIKQGADLIKYAYEKGINFLDTAELYDNYEYIKEALKYIDRSDYVIATKTYAYTKDLAKASLEDALKRIDTDYIDLFLLHEQESIHTVRGHYEAIEYLLKAKSQGKIRAIGISTHRVSGVLALKEFEELEIVHPIINKEGIGIQDGNIDDMLKALQEVHDMGKGIYGMKPLGGGHLIKDVESAFSFVRDLKSLDSIAIGMQSRDEIDANISFFEKSYIPDSIKANLKKKARRLIVADYCIGCGNCVKRCNQGGISLIGNRAVPNEKCILCGYCATVCPEFCIKVI